MFCPQCRAEYREGIAECPDCGVPLVAELPPENADAEPEARLVRVYATGEASLLPVVHSLLDGAGIEYFAKSEEVQDLFGWGRMGTSWSYVVGPVEFLVREEDEMAAREVLQELASATPEDAEAPPTAGPEDGEP